MALTLCRDCKQEISKKAKTCPRCGAPQAKQYGWGTVLFFVFLGMVGYGLSTGDRSPSDAAITQKPAVYQGTGQCRQFVELSKDGALSHINVWTKPTPEGKGQAVGKIVAGSRAILLETLAEDFKVQSLYDSSVGYINQMQVSGMLRLDDKTFQPCN